MAGNMTKGRIMSAEHETIARRIYDILEAGAYDRLPEVFADEFVEHETLPGSTKSGFAALQEAMDAYRTAFPDLHFEATSVIAEGDRIAVHYTFTGTNKGEFMGMPATGRSVNVQGVDIGRMTKDGRCAEHWGFMHEGDLMGQLGLTPQQASGDIDITDRTAAPA
jgi:steroid delta-isomerase-like uncharacterized protein